MLEFYRAEVFSVNENNVILAVQSGPWKNQQCVLPPRNDVKPRQTVYILINDDGTEAKWPS